MLQYKTALKAAKIVTLMLAVGATSQLLAGCGDADSHPSQMIKNRSQMQRQKDQMRSAPAPSTAGGSTTGQ